MFGTFRASENYLGFARRDEPAVLKTQADCNNQPHSCESTRKPAGNICDACAPAKVADWSKEL